MLPRLDILLMDVFQNPYAMDMIVQRTCTGYLFTKAVEDKNAKPIFFMYVQYGLLRVSDLQL